MAVRAKRLYLVLGAVAAALVAYQWLPPKSRTPGDEATPAGRPRSDSHKSASTAPVPSLPPRNGLARPAGQPFHPLSWQPPVPKTAALAEPARRIVPYRVAGTVTYQAEPRIVLAKGNAVVIVREGDMLEDGYRVEAVGPDHVSLVYVPSGTVEQLPLASGGDSLPGRAPAPNAAAGNSTAPTPLALPPRPSLPPLPR